MSRDVKPAHLVLADGTTFAGEAIGAEAPDGVATGEVVFNTVLAGYQEVVTDPSYAGQIIAFTYPHIGNYGVNGHDSESRRPFCRGVIVRDLARRPSSWRSEEGLGGYLARTGVSGVAGIDTRRLTRHLRSSGAMPAAFGTADPSDLAAAAASAATTDGLDMVAEVTTPDRYEVTHNQAVSQTRNVNTGAPLRVVAYDFGIKTNILRQLAEIASVEVVPASTPAAEVLAGNPDGVFLSNGPGDPAGVPYAVEAVRQLVGQVPIFGICLGHQLLGRALGGDTFKLRFGHHGGNHPVRRLATGAVEITSQNHNYAVDAESLASAQSGAGGAGWEVTHVNLNDGVVEGMRCKDVAAFSVQYHPEAGPGPHDARYLFEEFRLLMTGEGGK